MDSETDPTCIRKWTRIQTQTREISQIQNPTQPVVENEPKTQIQICHHIKIEPKSVTFLRSKIHPNLYEKMNPNLHRSDLISGWFNPNPLTSTSNHIQPFSDIFGHLWPLPATSDDHFLPLLTFSGHYKAFTGFPATSNHIHPFMSILSHFWPFLTTCDPIWPLPPTSDDPFWPLMTISDHLKVPNCRGRHLEGDYYIQLT